MNKAVFFFCNEPVIDPVASSVYAVLAREQCVVETSDVVDGYPVMALNDAAGNQFRLVRTANVISHDYGRYLEMMQERFGDYDFAGVVNWHEGQNAPDRILTVQTTGDMASGQFGNVDPILVRSLLLAVEDERCRAEMHDFRTILEGTHWSGKLFSTSPERIRAFAVPTVDIEIGSSPIAWADPRAVAVIARAVVRLFERQHELASSLLCVGGVHIEDIWARAVINTVDRVSLACSHVLPNQWIVAHGYDTESGYEMLRACVASIRNGVCGIVYHDKLKARYKDQVRRLGRELAVPVFKHQKLRERDPFEQLGKPGD